MPDEEKTVVIPATDGRTIAELKASDSYEDLTLDHIDDGLVGTKEGTGFGIPEEDLAAWMERTGKEPKPGMKIRLYPGGLGSQIHGIDLDGDEIYWRTPAERAANRAQWLADYDRRQREEFAKEKGKLDADYEALPEALQRRIDRFRGESDGFRVTSEGYEMFCCVEGAKFLGRAQTAVAHGNDTEDVAAFWKSERGEGWVWSGERPESPEAAWLLWAWALVTTEDDGHERQKKLLDPSPEHSGHTFGSAMMLATRLAQGESV